MLYRRSMLTKALPLLAVAALVVSTACGSGSHHSAQPTPNAQQNGLTAAKTRQNYSPKNDVEGRNYNSRLRIADDPSTLLWCTAFPTNPNAPLITVPIVGKLTSGNKRPYATERAFAGGIDGAINEDFYDTEKPGPDGFFGNSGEYRYGFRPDGVYADFYNLEMYCTTEPTTFQREKTVIDVGSDAALNAVDAKVQDALKACLAAQTDKTTVKACPDAQRLLSGTGK